MVGFGETNMIKRVIRSLKNSKVFRTIFARNCERVKLNNIDGGDHPWQKDLDHLAERLGHDKIQVATSQETKVAESTLVEEDYKKLFNEIKQEMQQQKQSGTKPVVTRKKRESDITAVDLQSWWGQAVATWDPIDSKNVDSVSQQPRRQRTKWFDGH